MAAGGGGGRPPGPDPALEPYVQTRIFKIIVIGDSNVGKTCLTFRFCGGTFPGKTEATIGVDFREKTVEIEGERIKVGPAAAPGWLTPAPVGPALSSVSPALSLLGPAGSPSSDGSRSPSLPLAKPLVGAFPFIPVGGREQGQGRIFIPVLQRCPWTSPCCLVTISGAGLSLQRSEVMARGESLPPFRWAQLDPHSTGVAPIPDTGPAEGQSCRGMGDRALCHSQWGWGGRGQWAGSSHAGRLRAATHQRQWCWNLLPAAPGAAIAAG